ncbi:MAG: TlpA family protein disulfide reductase [Lachnospiraceae bacterium]|nr:TlpA family protein disulfide reductase [Lachnospiraceae bacterium]
MKNQKHCTILLSLLIVLTLIGCNAGTQGQNSGSDTPAPSAVPETETVVTPVRERGLTFSIAQEYIDKGVTLEPASENAKGYKNIGIFYYSPTSIALLEEINSMDSAALTQELVMEYLDKILSTSRCLMEVVMIETAQYDSLTASGAKPEDFTYFTPAEVMGTNDGYTYVLSIPDLDDGTLNETEAADYHDCKAYMQTVRDNLAFIPIESGNIMPDFTTKDINGVEVSSSIFSEKKLTVVNVWGTFCGPCIAEMPELADWAREMGDDMQLIGIVGDISGETDTQHIALAQTIAQKANVEFTNLIPNDDLSGFMSNIVGFPTTFFVDQTGAIVGDPIVGANVERCKEFAEAYLSEH